MGDLFGKEPGGKGARQRHRQCRKCRLFPTPVVGQFENSGSERLPTEWAGHEGDRQLFQDIDEDECRCGEQRRPQQRKVDPAQNAVLGFAQTLCRFVHPRRDPCQRRLDGAERDHQKADCVRDEHRHDRPAQNGRPVGIEPPAQRDPRVIDRAGDRDDAHRQNRTRQRIAHGGDANCGVHERATIEPLRVGKEHREQHGNECATTAQQERIGEKVPVTARQPCATGKRSATANTTVQTSVALQAGIEASRVGVSG